MWWVFKPLWYVTTNHSENLTSDSRMNPGQISGAVVPADEKLTAVRETLSPFLKHLCFIYVFSRFLCCFVQGQSYCRARGNGRHFLLLYTWNLLTEHDFLNQLALCCDSKFVRHKSVSRSRDSQAMIQPWFRILVCAPPPPQLIMVT